MHRSLAAFGASVLTRRERQVVELVLLGHNTRLIAEKLGISMLEVIFTDSLIQHFTLNGSPSLTPSVKITFLEGKLAL